MTRNYRDWEDEEVTILRTLAGAFTSYEIGHILGRSSDSVKHRARRLRVSLRTYGERCPWSKYSNEQAELARSLHEQGGVKIREIGDRLGIPYHALHSIIYFKRGLGYNPHDLG